MSQFESVTPVAPSRRRFYLGLLSAALAVAVLSPVLASGFSGDDVGNGILKFRLAFEGESFLTHTGNFIVWWGRQGRFFPIALLTRVVHVWFPNLAMYKLVLFSLSLANVGLFGYLLALLRLSPAMAIYGVGFAALLMPIRISQEALLSYAGMFQLLAALSIGSMCCLILAVRSAFRPWMFGASVVLHVMACMTYEAVVPFCLLHLLIVRAIRPGRLSAAVRYSWPFFAASALLGVIPFLLRSYFGIPLTGDGQLGSVTQAYSVHLDKTAFFWSFLKHASGSLPWAYLGWDPHHLFDGLAAFALSSASALPLLVGIGYMVATYEAGSDVGHTRERDTQHGVLFSIGLLWWLLPNAVIALAPKYQSWAAWGWGYLQTYLAQFGMMLCILTVMHRLWRGNARAARFAVISCALLTAAWGGIQSVQNTAVVEQASITFHGRSQWDVINRALDHSLPSSLPEGAVIYCDTEEYWNHPGLLARSNPRRVQTLYSKETLPPPAAWDSLVAQGLYYLTYYSESDGHGFAIVSRVEGIRRDLDGELAFAGSEFDIYTRYHFEGTASPVVSGEPYERAASNPWTLTAKQISQTSGGPGWRVYHARAPRTDLRTLFAAPVHQTHKLATRRIEAMSSSAADPR